MKKYWFKPKRYGYGFCPISWEGWLATLFLVGLLFLSAHINNFFTPEIKTENGLMYLLNIFIIAGLFTFLFRNKVEGGLQWRWGDKKIINKKH